MTTPTTKINTNTAHQPPPATSTTDNNPHVVIQNDGQQALRLNPGGLFDPLPYRQALSVLLQIAGLGDLDYTAARALLGLPPASNAVCAHFTKTLRQTGTWEPVLAALSHLARTLDEQSAPIDYGRRRRWRRISAATLDSKAWRTACTQIRYRSSARQERLARLHLIELLTGNHPYFFPQPLTLSPAVDGEDYATFVFSLPAQLSEHLHQQAQTLLRRLRIDEPVTWEPPFDWVDTSAWPGPHPDDVRPEQLWTLVRAGLPRSEIATRLHTTPEHIHLAAIRHPQPRTRRHSPKPDTDITSASLPREHELRAYIDQGLRPGQIAQRTGCSHQRISTLMASSGLGPPAPREVLRTLDPAWLREQYEDKQRSSPTSPPTSASQHPIWPGTRVSSDSRSATASPRTSTSSPAMATPAHSPPPSGPSSPPVEPNNASTVSRNSRTPRLRPRRQTPRRQKGRSHPSSRPPRTRRRRPTPGNHARLSWHQADFCR